ncbi:MAG TPA: ferrous iron transport protein B [Thermoguttaceae bacterium]
MATATAKKIITVALVGNPNTGKSTVFSALAGIHQHVGNYPGVTVEKKTGRMDFAHQRYELVDLPGLYSLAPRSSDEMVTVNVLLGRQKDAPEVDAIICILDASNLARNLYLVSQVLELGKPTVLAVNMLDVAKSRGITLDLPRLQQQLGVPVVGMQAHRRIGVADLKVALARAVVTKLLCPCGTVFCEVFERETALLQNECGSISAADGTKVPMPAFLARRLLLDSNGYLERTLSSALDMDLNEYLQAARERLATAGCHVPGVETSARYDWINRAVNGAVTEPSRYFPTYSDLIDRILTNRVAGLAIFALTMLVIFQSVFAWAKPAMNAIQAATSALGVLVVGFMPDGALESLLVDGVISGVGAVLAFLPQILILFMFIGLLEDCGYMARAAFLMDRIMSRVGLSGRSCIPMLSSFACAVPGIMAARVIENERDRLTTILVAPLLTCSARLPVYSLLIAAFIPSQTYLGGLLNLQGLVFAGLYVLGIVMAIAAAMIMKRTLLRGQSPPFVLELPSYKWPSLRIVAYRVGQRGWVFLRFAGTLILTVSILVWAGLYYPHDPQVVAPLLKEREELKFRLAQTNPDDPLGAEIAAGLAQLERDIQAAYQRNSILGHLGRVIEPAVKPLGWDWRIGCAVIASLPAREVVVATLGVMYNLGKDTDLDSETGYTALQKRIRSVTWDGTDKPVYNIPVALSIMVFFALCLQCIATLAVIRRETNSWRWPLFAFTYMTSLAYIGALITYQLGMWLSS